MKLGDTLYYVNSNRNIDKYVITDMDEDTSTIEIEICSIDFPLIKYRISGTDLSANELSMNSRRLFTNIDDALAFKKELDAKYEEQRQNYFDKLLDEVLNTPTLSDVEQKGKLLKTKETSNSNIDEVIEANLYCYENDLYVVVYKSYKRHKDSTHYTRECISFTKVHKS